MSHESFALCQICGQPRGSHGDRLRCSRCYQKYRYHTDEGFRELRIQRSMEYYLAHRNSGDKK